MAASRRREPQSALVEADAVWREPLRMMSEREIVDRDHQWRTNGRQRDARRVADIDVEPDPKPSQSLPDLVMADTERRPNSSELRVRKPEFGKVGAIAATPGGERHHVHDIGKTCPQGSRDRADAAGYGLEQLADVEANTHDQFVCPFPVDPPVWVPFESPVPPGAPEPPGPPGKPPPPPGRTVAATRMHRAPSSPPDRSGRDPGTRRRTHRRSGASRRRGGFRRSGVSRPQARCRRSVARTPRAGCRRSEA